MLRPACLLPPKRLLTPRSARRLSATNRGLLPGTPVSTHAEHLDINATLGDTGFDRDRDARQ